jgi:hypothetical protein
MTSMGIERETLLVCGDFPPYLTAGREEKKCYVGGVDEPSPVRRNGLT